MSARPARLDWSGRSGLPALPARPAKLGRLGLAGLARPATLGQTCQAGMAGPAAGEEVFRETQDGSAHPPLPILDVIHLSQLC